MSLLSNTYENDIIYNEIINWFNNISNTNEVKKVISKKGKEQLLYNILNEEVSHLYI